MIRRAVFTAVLIAGLFAGHTAAIAAEPTAEIVTIEFVGSDGTRFIVNDRPYAGPMTFTLYRGGIALTESATIEQYLQGIAEMPFLWPDEALAAQAVAARTYLSRRLLGGRSGDGTRYGYDICATSRCQVYRGTQLVEGDYGDRWREAIEATSGEVVLYDGRPIEAVYTSMVGSRSRANQDVWASSAIPYLQPVDSPEVGIAPYATWDFEISARQFIEILRADGMDVSGSLDAVVVDDPPEGEGRTEITVITSGGTDSILAPAMKGVFNRQGDELYPGALPATLQNGTRLPEPLPSYTYELTHLQIPPRFIDVMLPDEDQVSRDVIRFVGEGWGHGIGMSQWGARILADRGETYDAILSHYYGGLVPETAPSVVPAEVTVGLATERAAMTLTMTGAAQLLVNGVPFGTVPAGEWVIRSTASGLGIVNVDDRPTPHPLQDRHWPR
ncbi:MAG: SpoIID/LytB domain-containing protein [Acidimicrobiia bacterium]